MTKEEVESALRLLECGAFMPLQKKWELTGAVMDHLMHTKAVEREEAEKTKRASLEEQERAVSLADAVFHAELPNNELHCCKALNAARDTLKTLREEVVPFIQAIGGGVLELGTMATASSRSREILRKLGVET